MTIVTRLCDKGLLQRQRRGRGFVYRPALSKEELAARSLREVLASSEDPHAVLARFVEDLEASPELLARLRALAQDSPDAGRNRR
jgi:predicted transcriptional regulator